jgi:hypothetical protein
MIRRTCLSIAQRKSFMSVALALVGATAATGALAQTVTQTLTLGFTAAAPVPIDGWAAVAIAVLLAIAGVAVLRRRSSTGAWLWCAALLGTGALFGLQPIRSAEALIPITPLSLVTSPASVQFVFPGAPDPTVVLVTNNTGGTTTILSIVLGPGPLGTTASTTPCVVGTILAANATCTIGLSS